MKSSHLNDFGQVEHDEQLWCKRRREVAGIDADSPRVGLALSGGGVRSATFNAGVLSSLSRHGIMKYVDYLSTVSGGGYVGACYSSSVNRYEPEKDSVKNVFERPVADEDTTVMGWLRAHGKYLISEPGFSGWTLGASILASISLNLLVFLPVVLVLVAVMSYDLTAFAWPAQWLPETFNRIAGHDGFGMLLLAGLGCWLAYGVLVLLYALVSGVPALRSTQSVLRLRRWMGWAVQCGFVLIALGLIPVMALLDEAMLTSMSADWVQRVSQHATYLTPAAGGVMAIWQSLRQSRKAQSASGPGILANVGLGLLLYGMVMFAYHLVMHTSLMTQGGFLVVLALALTLGLLCDPNWVSMHSYYRARIASAFMPRLGGDCRQGKVSAFDYPLTAMSPYSGAPVHLINTTLNTRTSLEHKWRSREGASFTLSPLYCGSALTGFKRTSDYMNGTLALSTAVTISGAAVDPNNALVRSRPLSALMSLLNCRLGFWADNPGLTGPRRLGADWFSLVGREVLGVGLNERSRHVHLSDGGQYDNLGVYELLRRRTRYIIASDAGADPQYGLSDLARLIDLAQADFGARIVIDAQPLLARQKSQRGFCPCALGRIEYADGSCGELLYLKTMTYEAQPTNVYAYAHRNPAFPNESTSNQFYGETQFDAYQTLGRDLIDRLLAAGTNASGVEGLFEAARQVVAGDASTAVSKTAGAERRRPGSPLRERLNPEPEPLTPGRSLSA